MFRLDADLRIYLHREPIDFRARINSLVTLVEQSMQLDPLARFVFAFHNRKRESRHNRFSGMPDGSRGRNRLSTLYGA
ncbi:IS66 family insertion sequence element accessory protein TnpB [Paraburkholderia humisilvae]|uniref:Transposase n=1 Tax=Paraburkholderia humisilvae TaxID=627669 RepID=A0A6J5FCJ6_9BURK|nr:IS66 family insertion sequence element accessory protein TnpB [Paraburkholderia humisilvae]CAB3775177.1 hypothetical protein LMG29542_08559 [Paraburkholderia humisilvae]